MMKTRIILSIFLIITLGVITSSILLLEIGSIALVVSLIYELVTQKKELFPIGLIALSFAGVQWLISPILTYHSHNNLFSMSVDEDVYLSYTIIGYVALWAGVMLLRNKINNNITLSQAEKYCKRMRRQSLLILVVGGVFMPLPVHAPSLLFIKELCSCLFFIGIIMQMLAKEDKAILIGGCGISYLMFLSIIAGMFHTAMLWGVFILIIIFFIKDYPIKRRLIVVVIAFFCVTTLQSVKSIYRSYTWGQSYQGSKITLFFDLYYDSLLSNLNDVTKSKETDQIVNQNNSTANDEDINSRFNQGWIISMVYSHIPQYLPYQEGRTVVEALETTFIPKFIIPNSNKTSIQEFETFTGYHITKNTSMGLSVWGEAYGNFGVFGGAIFMFIWGMLISGLLRLLNILTKEYGYWIFFTPLIAFNLIKAEINILPVMNWTVKAMIFAGVIIYILRHSYPDRNAKLILQEKA